MSAKKQATKTRKHLARAQREARLRRWILGGTILTLALAIGFVAYGWYRVRFSPVAWVNGEAISPQVFAGQVRLRQVNLLQNALILHQFGDEERRNNYLREMADKELLGNAVLERLIEQYLIRQEARRRGIEVTEEDVDRSIAENFFGFYPEGTPTALPTITPDPTQLALASLTPPPTAGPSPTPGPTPTASATPTTPPTATPYTRQLFEQDLGQYLNNMREQFGITEQDFRLQVELQLYQERLLEIFRAEVPREQEQVRARHILVQDEETAREVLERLEKGEDFGALAAEYSIDETNKDRGGDLGWFPRGRMVPPFEEAVFSAQVGEVVGPVETSFGWHIIEVLDRQVRPLDEASFNLALSQAFGEFLEELRAAAEIKIDPYLASRVPDPPDISGMFR